MRVHHLARSGWLALPLALLLAAQAAAQPAETPAAGAGESSLLRGAADRRRAPLQDLADLEPAVDASARTAPRVAAAPEAPAAAAPRPAPSAGTPRVMDTLDLGTTSITGNQELPKVLYIVPWKRSDLGELVGRPANTLLDEVLAPIDRQVFERHLDYYDTLYGTAKQEE